LASGAQALRDPAYGKAAEDALNFILHKMRKKDGRLYHRYRDGEAKITAHLDDYAFLIWGLIELYEATFNVNHLKLALDLNRDMLEYYWDDKKGGLFFTPDDGEALIVRKKEVYDGAVPSGNAVAFYNLLRLARITGNADLEERAAQIGRAFSEQVQKVPSGYTQFLVAVDFAIGPSYEVVIAGKPGARDTVEMIQAVQQRYFPNHVLLFHPWDESRSEIEKLAEFVKLQNPLNGKATVYVCLAQACKTPTTLVSEMLELLK
jgi:uncharacterized protein YyaL (SSP411 family)